MEKMLKVAVLVALVTLMVPTANAGLILYTDRAEFESAVESALSFEGFNSSSELNDDLSINTNRYRTSSSLVTEGDKALGLKEDSEFTVSFAHDVFAIGFDLNELNTTDLNYIDSAGHEILSALKVTDVWNDSQFFGLISDVAITSFTLSASGDDRALYGFDAMAYTAGPVAVSAPSSTEMLLMSFVVLLAFKAKRYRARV